MPKFALSVPPPTVISQCPLQVNDIKNPKYNWPTRLGDDPLLMTVKTLDLLTLLLLLLLSETQWRIFID